MLLVTGCPRSGTQYTAECLRHAGLRVKHEVLDADGTVDWRLAPEAANWPVVVHQVRHPLKTIASFTTMMPTSWRRLATGAGVRLTGDKLRDGMRIWVGWNRLLEGHWRVRVEDITPEKAWPDLCERAGLPRHTTQPAVSTRRNARPHDDVSWDDLYAADPVAARAVREMATRYNYAAEVEWPTTGNWGFVPYLAAALRRRRVRSALEWGPGISTDVLLTCCPEAHVVSVEHDPTWYAKAEATYGHHPHWHGCLRPLDEGYDAVGYDTTWDVFLVDGRRRIACLGTAGANLAPGGIVMLHDAQRERYRPGIERFPYRWTPAHHTVFLAKDETALNGEEAWQS